MRQIVEKEIATAIVDSLLAAGFRIEVDNGDEETLPIADRATILKSMFLTDEERLFVFKKNEPDWFGWVYLVYGNDGWDVLSDYTVNLEKVRRKNGSPAAALADKYGD